MPSSMSLLPRRPGLVAEGDRPRRPTSTTRDAPHRPLSLGRFTDHSCGTALPSVPLMKPLPTSRPVVDRLTGRHSLISSSPPQIHVPQGEYMVLLRATMSRGSARARQGQLEEKGRSAACPFSNRSPPVNGRPPRGRPEPAAPPASGRRSHTPESPSAPWRGTTPPPTWGCARSRETPARSALRRNRGWRCRPWG